MERPEFNLLRKMAKGASNLIVDEAQNMLRISLYTDGELKKVVVVMKCDSYRESKLKIERIVKDSTLIKRE